MILCAVLVCMQDAGDWSRALEAGDFRAAWLAGQALAEPERTHAEVRILYQAGDPAGAWAAARRGLVAAPQDLEFHFYATGAALWLGEAEAARESSARLAEAIAASRLGAEERAAWERTAQGYSASASELERGADARARALRRSQAGALTGLGLALLALFLLARAGAPVEARS